ncbi:MAG TPA: P-loop NTPase [Solirubrobacteraceae bacterium]|nr:P-loop NTPase [Solirubrobacteraceae bacterium]
MTLRDLVAALRRFWRPALAAFALIFGLGVASLLLRPERYRSEAVLSVEPAGGNLGFDAQQAIQLTIPPLLARLRAPTFVTTIRLRVDPRFRAAHYRVIAANDPGTPIINFAVESSSRQAAEQAADVAVRRLEAQPGSQRFRIVVLSPPGAATSVRAQRTPPILGGAFVLGLIVAVLGAAAAHRLRPRLPRADEFRALYGHEVLGEIPRARDGRQPAEAMVNGRGSPEMLEAFRSLEARLTMRAMAGGRRDLSVSIAVTSWGKSEGVSTVVTNLAFALATLGRDVTIVDCDMRRPAVHRLLGLDLEPGVADVGDAGAPIAALRKAGEHPSLDVVTAGRPERHPAEIVQEALPRLLSELRDRTVIIDTPPMFAAETTAIVARADFVVLVADYLERNPDEIDNALDELALTATPVLGVVLNRVDLRDSRGRASYAYQAGPPPRPRGPRR